MRVLLRQGVHQSFGIGLGRISGRAVGCCGAICNGSGGRAHYLCCRVYNFAAIPHHAVQEVALGVAQLKGNQGHFGAFFSELDEPNIAVAPVQEPRSLL